MSSTIGEEDLGWKVEDSLARFDKAVRESSNPDTLGDEDKLYQASSSTSISDTVTGNSGDILKGRPRCRPWNYDDFMGRLKTYTSLGWFAKPPFASPPNCARFGWINQKRDVLACPCCGAQLTFSRGEEEAREAQDESGIGSSPSLEEPRSFLSRLESEHHDLCPWKGNPSPVDFLHLPHRAHDDWRRDFLERLRSIMVLVRSQGLPEPTMPTNFAQRYPRGLTGLARRTKLIQAEESSALPKAGASESGRAGDGDGHDMRQQLARVHDETLGVCAAFAMFGWRAVSAHRDPNAADPEEQPRCGSKEVTDREASPSRSSNKTYRLWCKRCNRRVLTDNFLAAEMGRTGSGTPGSSPQTGEEGASTKPAKRRRLSGGGTPLMPMDLVGEHRSFCPWARVHPMIPGLVAPRVPGWVLTMEALMAFEDPGASREAGPPGDLGDPCGDSDRKILLDAAIVVEEDGAISAVYDMNDDGAEDTVADLMSSGVEVADFRGKLIMPGFVDAHAHAPQYSFTGTGMDLPLLKWLETHTFPVEARFRDPAFARKVYEKAIRRHLKYGSTTCSYFATIHLEATKVLVDVIRGLGQRAHVGKVSMDRNAPDYILESTEDAKCDAEEFVKFVSDELDDSLITPVVTPRFVPSCSPELMGFLGEISRKYDVPVQSHLSESPGELAWVSQLHPEVNSYAGVYEKYGLMNERSYFAHCVYCTREERSMLFDTKASVVHCPSSNFMLCSGVANVRRYLTEGVKVGLGTDVAGGYSCSMLDCMRQAMVAANVCCLQPDEDGTMWNALSFQEVFHLATMGGAEVLGLDGVIGNFELGKQFDALVVNPSPGCGGSEVELEGSGQGEGPFDLFPELGEGMQAAFEKFLFLGDDRNIEQVFVAGNRVL